MLKQGTLHSPCTYGKLKNPELRTPIKAAMHLKSSIRSLFKLTQHKYGPMNLADKQKKSKVKGPDLKIRGQRELSAKLLDCKAVFRE